MKNNFTQIIPYKNNGYFTIIQRVHVNIGTVDKYKVTDYR